MTAQFKVSSVNEDLVSAIQHEFALPRFVAATMVAHGVSDIQSAGRFLTPSLERDWRNPYEIPQMDAAVDAVERAVRQGKRIVVFGDFDLDGISATTVLTRGLRALGADVVPFIPKRFEEGYGITSAALERVAIYQPDLVVTVDCGISCAKEATEVLERGWDLVITDHHEPGALVPQGIPVADPKCDPDCASSILAGVGVALKMVQALGARFGQPHLWREYTDLATLGTVADLMPLRGENRALVADGMRLINEAPRPSIAALAAVCNLGGKALTSTNLSFSLIPRLNAAGRMGNADLALDLLMADDFALAQDKAAQLDQVNTERRAIESDLAECASAQAQRTYTGQRALVVAGEGWHEGVKGIVASRLSNTYGVPTILFSIEGDEARGSGRSVGSVNLFKAVESCSDLLIRFGGHEAAVGVTLPADKIDQFAQRLCDYMDDLPQEDFHPLVHIESMVDLSELTVEAVDALSRLAPFGQDNPTPRFLAHNVLLERCRAVGADKSHLACTLTDGVSKVDGIMFHCEAISELMACGSVMDAAFEVQVDEWRGRRNVKCMLKVLEPAVRCPALAACLPAEDLDFVDELVDEGDSPSEAGLSKTGCPTLRSCWKQIAAGSPEAFTRELVKAIAGEDAGLYPSQARALRLLEEGKNTLAVMATGRGKSLIFQVHAARCALSKDQASILVYPLRALISDQFFHMTSVFSKLGLTVACLTGESSRQEREIVYQRLSQGALDAVLTTPEYLAFHTDEFAACGRIGFLAVDEAHHMGASGMGKREAYELLTDIVARLGNPCVLAVTATAPDKVAEDIRTTLKVNAYVKDETSRPNLLVDDRRGIRDKDSYLAGIVASGEKTIVYVNSRVGSVDLARILRSKVPQIAMQIGFYNAGLSREERLRVESLFRTGVLRVLVCTSAFGEGVNIPDVSHVVLYGMPFSDVEFNQISGRAGRNGQKACIHLLFGRDDVSSNQSILFRGAPDRQTMGAVYRLLRDIQRDHAQAAQASTPGYVTMQHDGRTYFTASCQELSSLCATRNPGMRISPEVCQCALAVFDQLELIDLLPYSSEGGKRIVHVRDFDGKVELSSSVLYREGLGELDEFEAFANWALSSGAEVLRDRLIHPILPGWTW